MASTLSIPAIVMDGPADDDMQIGSDVEIGQNDGGDFDIDIDSVGDASAQGDLDLMDADVQDQVMDEQTPLLEAPFNQTQDSWSAVDIQEPRSSEMLDENPDEDIDAPMPEMTNEEEDIDAPIPDADEADEVVEREEAIGEGPPGHDTYTTEDVEAVFTHAEPSGTENATTAFALFETDVALGPQEDREIHGGTQQTGDSQEGEGAVESGILAEGDNGVENVVSVHPSQAPAAQLQESSSHEAVAHEKPHEPLEENIHGEIAEQPDTHDEDEERHPGPAPTHDTMSAGLGQHQDASLQTWDANTEKDTVDHGSPEDQTDSLDGYLHMHPVKVIYQDSEISLFAPIGDDESQFFLQDETVAKQGIDQLFAALREVLGSSIADGEQLTLHVTPLNMDLFEVSRI